jgi:3-hydroxybutyryl-CoA dehydratase
MSGQALTLGARAQTRRAYSASDLADFARLTGTPLLHTVPEPLMAGLISYLLGVHLPGPGTNYLKQELTFLSSAPLDEILTASVEITRLRPDKALVDLATLCTRPNGVVVCSGRALVLAKDVG